MFCRNALQTSRRSRHARLRLVQALGDAKSDEVVMVPA
jgi:hypothetical protein